MLQTNTKIITVLIPVAKFKLILDTPIFAKIAVNAAKTAESKA